MMGDMITSNNCLNTVRFGLFSPPSTTGTSIISNNSTSNAVGVGAGSTAGLHSSFLPSRSKNTNNLLGTINSKNIDWEELAIRREAILKEAYLALKMDLHVGRSIKG